MSKTFLFQAIQFSQTIQFSISMPLVLFNPTRCYHSGPEWTWEQWRWRGTPYSLKLQHHWNLTIRLFSVISGHSLGGGILLLRREAVGVFYSPSWLGQNSVWIISFNVFLIFVKIIYFRKTKEWIKDVFLIDVGTFIMFYANIMFHILFHIFWKTINQKDKKLIKRIRNNLSSE